MKTKLKPQPRLADMRSAAPKCAETEHNIGYAYATSDLADKLKQPGGCHYIEIGDVTVARDSYEHALETAAKAGTMPGRWSKDHPLNAQFLRVAT